MDKRGAQLNSRLSVYRALARLFLYAEQVWASSALIFCVTGLFVAVTFSGFWQAIDPFLHLTILFVFAAGVLWGIRQFRGRFTAPDRDAIHARLEQESGLSHRPLRSQLAEPVRSLFESEKTSQFWELHQQQQALALEKISLFHPRLGLSSGDKYSFRSLVLILIFSGFMIGGIAPFQHFKTAFTPNLSGPVQVVEMDIWAVPPDYTGFAPQLIKQSQPQISKPSTPEQTIQIPVFRLPQGSKFVGRVSGGDKNIPKLLNGPQTHLFDQLDPLNFQIELPDISSGRWTLKKDSETLLQWDVDIIPDLAPIIRILTLPDVTDRAALQLAVLAEDDYGILDLKAHLSRLDSEGSFELVLPFSMGSTAIESKSYHDLTAHPWAGLPVELWVEGADHRGQSGQSKKVKITLPERDFLHPVARALALERKQLFINPEENRIDVVGALDVIISLPEAITKDLSAILMVSVARSTLLFREEPQAITEAAELLWQAALKFENGNLTLAEQALRDAEQKLMVALNNGASDDEIKQLVEELKQAMSEFLKELSRNQDQAQSNPNGAEALETQDLNNILDQIDDFARSGARDEARKLLSQLQDILENLQATGPKSGQPSKADRQMLENMEKLLGKQQDVLDQTLQSTQRSGYFKDRPSDSQPQQFGDLAKQQEALRQMLGEMMTEMGMKGKIPGALGKAERAMNTAREQLQLGDGSEAQLSQQQAMQQLQKGLEGMAQAQGMGASGRYGKNGPKDPLGRSSGGQGKEPNPDNKLNIFDKSNLSNTRAVLNELRRRLSDPNRSDLEKKYLKRLLERF